MKWTGRLGHYRFNFNLFKVQDLKGVHSQVGENDHIPMWDFDDSTLEQVTRELKIIQSVFGLSKIYILNSGRNGHYIAYCLKRFTIRRVAQMIVATEGVCWFFLKFGLLREKFTLRISAKHGRTPKVVKILPSKVPENVTPDDLQQFVKYEALDAGD